MTDKNVAQVLTVIISLTGGIIIGVVIGIKIASDKKANELRIDINGDLSKYKTEDLLNYKKKMEDAQNFESCAKIRDELSKRTEVKK